MADDTRAEVRLDLIENFRFSVTFPLLEGAPPLVADEAPPLGEGAGPTPATLLATAVGGCLASSMLFCLRKAHVEAPAVTASAVAHIVRNQAGRFRIAGLDVELSLAVAEKDRQGLSRCEELFEDFCIVTESVRRGIPVNVKLTLGQPGGSATAAEG